MASVAIDVNAVLRSDTLAQVFAAARPMAAAVLDTSELPEHPLEDGSVIVDHAIQKPIEISLPLLITGPDLKQVFAEISDLYRAKTLLVVQGRTGSYASMVIQEMPHEESGDTIDSVTVGLKLKQVRIVTSKLGAKVARRATQRKTAKRGTQQPKAATPAQTSRGSTLYRITR